MTASIQISPEVARRFVLGKQGIWPGRREHGIAGTERAMRNMEHLQLDPLQIIARSQDIKLHSRVVDYNIDDWQTLTYGHRKFFDWGGWLAVRPMNELPYFRRLMKRDRDLSADWKAEGRKHRVAIEEMRTLLKVRETVTNRDFAMADRTRHEGHYRGRKDSALALYYLWRMGEVMTHHRERFERSYARTDLVAPPHLITEAGDNETDRFMLLKEIAFYGLHDTTGLRGLLHRPMNGENVKSLLAKLEADGLTISVQVEGWKERYIARAEDVSHLADLNAGRVPSVWALDPVINTQTTADECTFLSPLDNVSARGRALRLFDFAFTWEVYTKEHLRKFGYYALPVLWGDKIVARFDSKLDRTTNTYVILGLWLEDKSLAKNEAFANALAAGFVRFTRFLGADMLDATAIREPLLKRAVKEHFKTRGLSIVFKPPVPPGRYPGSLAFDPNMS